MKLLYLANLRLPTEKAHGVQIMKMCEAFQIELGKQQTGNNKQHAVTLVVPFRFRSPGLRYIADIFAYYGIHERFRIVTLPSLDLFPLARFLPFLDRLAFAVQYGSFLASCFLYLVMRSLFHVSGPVTFYSRDPRLVRLARRFSPNVFFELHTIPKRNDIRAASFAKGIIVLTSRLKEMLLARHVPAERVIVVPDAVDLSAFDAVRERPEDLRKRFNLPPYILIGYAGRLKTMGEEKGIPELLEAFSVIKKEFGNAFLCVLGAESADRERYADVLSDLRITGAVRFIPRVGPTEVPKYLKAFDVLVAPFPDTPHYRDAMSPLKIFEYMAAGRPIVATDLPSVREVLSEKNAVLVEPGSPESLAKGIRYCLQNVALSARILEQARHDVQEFTWQKRAERITSFIMI